MIPYIKKIFIVLLIGIILLFIIPFFTGNKVSTNEIILLAAFATIYPIVDNYNK